MSIAAQQEYSQGHLKEHVVPFTAGDGFSCNLIHVQGDKPSDKGPVLLVHGAGVRANIFRAPIQTTLVDYLIDNGYDVWLENWRASIDLTPNLWTLDQAALYDHPQAVKTVVEETGVDEIKAVIHCQGSTSFMMSAVTGLVPQVKTIVSNAVSLHVVVSKFSEFKMNFVVPPFRLLTDYYNPHWGVHAPSLVAKLVTLIAEITHHECDNRVCHQVSLMYGDGYPALWLHENLNDETHEWIKQEFAHVPLTFYKNIIKCIQHGSLVSVEGKKELPADFTAQPPQTEARFAFFAGEKNLCCLPVSQVKTFEYFETQRKDYHSLHLLPNYSHLDVFMGKNAATDVFPLMLAELDKPH